MKVICLRTSVVACLVLLGLSAEGRAQSAPDDWTVTVAPYVMAAGVNGTAGIGRLESACSCGRSRPL